MPDARGWTVLLAALLGALPAVGDEAGPGRQMIEARCGQCHGGAEPMGGFLITSTGKTADSPSLPQWRKALEYVRAELMPPPQAVSMETSERRELIAALLEELRLREGVPDHPPKAPPRRLNNREIANSVADVLLIEDVGTHRPLADLLGDTLHEGFDTFGDSLGMSQFHLEMYVEAFRKIVEATILVGPRPPSRAYEVDAGDMRMTSLSQRSRPERANRTAESIDFLDPRLRVYFPAFERAPASGRYQIRIRAAGKDRGVYDSAETGIYEGDPIRLRVHLGDRVRTFDLPDETPTEIVLDEWIAEETRLELSYPTDGLRLRGNGNFKFQYSIAHDHILSENPELHAALLSEALPRAPARTAGNPRHWSHWTGQWQGPRPRLYSAAIEGPIHAVWPPSRQVALLGRSPSADDAAAILRPIAERAWRREVGEHELEPVASLVRGIAADSDDPDADVRALREGVVAILASPEFLLVNGSRLAPAERFASRLSLFLQSTVPQPRILAAARSGALDDFEAVRDEIRGQFDRSEADEFLGEFPRAWLELDRINFMAPDPDRFPLYTRKRISEDMVAEVLRFFRHAVESNAPVHELLTADHTFLNADLARVYGVAGVPQDSQLRKHTFTDGRRGGLLGMGAFLTLTADSLSTSPIHRAVYVMEKFLAIRPAPPPGDVEIAEPDVREAKTIKQVLAAHTANGPCASCHLGIDPYGYAFEHFDPSGAWRDYYTAHIRDKPSRADLAELAIEDRRRRSEGLPPTEKPWEGEPIPVDSTATLPGGAEYAGIEEFRRHMMSDVNRDRFLRSFVEKLLMYALGTDPADDPRVEAILAKSAEEGYGIVDTIAAVIDSTVFRE